MNKNNSRPCHFKSPSKFNSCFLNECRCKNNDNNAYLQLLLRRKQSFLTTPCTQRLISSAVQQLFWIFNFRETATAFGEQWQREKNVWKKVFWALTVLLYLNIQQLSLLTFYLFIPFGCQSRNTTKCGFIYSCHKQAKHLCNIYLLCCSCFNIISPQINASACLFWHLKFLTFWLGASWLQASSLSSENVFVPRPQPVAVFLVTDERVNMFVCARVCVVIQ